MKKKGGYLPEPFEDEDDEGEFRRTRRFFRKKPQRGKNKRWRKGRS